jgi:hypothetical protein
LVKNLPEVYEEKRARLLRLSSAFSSLPEEIKKKTINEQSYYFFGWSCGKEIFNDKKGICWRLRVIFVYLIYIKEIIIIFFFIIILRYIKRFILW